ncbi:synaptonemal complex central element protein 2 [Genypterus blacodes]|uniref:synaptonemal complex central element protein 2 n=1 Tax=Genypterus blacodes TaxID=154954 RepID=UPI003F763AC8
MDSFLPSSSQSTPQPEHDEESDMFSSLAEESETTHQHAPGEKSSNMNMAEGLVQQTSPSVDNMSRRVQELLDKIHDRRNHDQKVLDSFQEKLVKKVTDVCQQMKEPLYTAYEVNSKVIEAKLQELTEVLDSCSKLSNELQEANGALEALRVNLATDPNI